ncbi:uncharacterized protein [Palaemon carinicauda]|uniref:uncharacterized protein n=1 Tax=Palaemon carinicauda TaxID=392227 RepID=UPI0035B6876E
MTLKVENSEQFKRIVIDTRLERLKKKLGKQKPLKLVLVIDVLSEEIRNEELWELLYADALEITAENEEDSQRGIVEWQESSERGGLRVNVDKNEFMVSSKLDTARIDIHKSRDSVIEQSKYLGSNISQDGGCEAEVENRKKQPGGKRREAAK